MFTRKVRLFPYRADNPPGDAAQKKLAAVAQALAPGLASRSAPADLRGIGVSFGYEQASCIKLIGQLPLRP